MIDGSGRIGRGVAYSTTEAVHLLNVRAEGMSAWAGEPNHFAARFWQEGGERRDFAQRRLFGRYLGEVLDDALATGCVELVHSTAIAGSREQAGWRISLDDGESIEARALVLAIGNQEPEALNAFAGARQRFIRNPWGDEARAAVADLAASGASALLVGTGLTMVDLVLSLEAAGHRGKILALSRRGLAPRAHADFDPTSVDETELPSRLGPLLRWLRRRGAEAGWRSAVDSLRPHTHKLWQGFTEQEQRRFLRHARPWWDVHRHRIAPQVAATLKHRIEQGRLEIAAGRIVATHESDDRLDVSLRRRGSAAVETASFAYAFNCTGPLSSIGRTKDPLLRSLLDSGEVAGDHLGIGLEIDSKCRAGTDLWAMGPLTKGRYWEIIAVPDIREQAAAVAADIERELGA